MSCFTDCNNDEKQAASSVKVFRGFGGSLLGVAFKIGFSMKRPGLLQSAVPTLFVQLQHENGTGTRPSMVLWPPSTSTCSRERVRGENAIFYKYFLSFDPFVLFSPLSRGTL